MSIQTEFWSDSLTLIFENKFIPFEGFGDCYSSFCGCQSTKNEYIQVTKKNIQTYHNISLLKPKILQVLLFTLSITRNDFEKKKRSKKKI